MTRHTVVRILLSSLLALVVSLSVTGEPKPPTAPSTGGPRQGNMYTPQPTPLICTRYCCSPTLPCTLVTCVECALEGTGYSTLSACQAACH